ncbi:hypothetical protein C9374_014257 [Naegleria lovaniensis]|uniref:Glycosyltransferase 61 catalytic domain-containing protein n=1 Tax=Naegleria lovaniensis TaxID=51637 RepID=A0AA88G5K8_NAELO|nr:uncharacterized protein C9374_014257 [Naegleria lovaniensis]KAG2370763.1 hypothetical protein C9374_014257 [Naegleria lovaniensis]
MSTRNFKDSLAPSSLFGLSSTHTLPSPSHHSSHISFRSLLFSKHRVNLFKLFILCTFIITIIYLYYQIVHNKRITTTSTRFENISKSSHSQNSSSNDQHLNHHTNQNMMNHKTMNHVNNKDDNTLKASNSFPPPQELPLFPRYDIHMKLNGNYRCNYKFEGQAHYTYYSCHFDDLCLATRGEFVLFHPKNRLFRGNESEYFKHFNEQIWTYSQGRLETQRGDFRVRILDQELTLKLDHPTKAPIAVSKNDQDNENVNQEETTTRKIVTLDSNFRYFPKPVYALKRYASGNMGHFIFDNIAMVIAQQMEFEFTFAPTYDDFKKLLDNHILYLDDLFDHSLHNWIGTYHYDEKQSDDITLEVSRYVTSNPILQLCKTKDKYSLEKLPCRNAEDVPLVSEPSPQHVTLAACFSQFRVGAEPVFKSFPGREFVFSFYRQLTFHQLGIYPLPSEEDDSTKMIPYLNKKPIKVVIHKKPIHKSSHGKVIYNVDEIYQALKTRIPSDPYLKLYHSHQRIEIQVLEFAHLPLSQQVQYFSDIDVYIADQGSASYYSVYLRKDTTAIVGPSCWMKENLDTGCWVGEGFMTIEGISHANIVSYLEIDHKNSCKPRPTEKDKEGCDPIFDPDLIVETVSAMLKKRYLKMVQNQMF